MATRWPFWKWRRWKSIGFCLWPPSTCIWSFQLKFQSKLDLHSGNHVTYRVQKPKNLIWPPGSHFEITLLKTNRLLPIYISIVPLKFKVDIQSQSKVRVRKLKNPIWPPGGHFESDVAENREASAYGHHQHAYENWNWNSKGNLTYAPETMSSTDRRTDGQTDGQCESSIPPPPSNFVGRGYNNSPGVSEYGVLVSGEMVAMNAAGFLLLIMR